MANVGIDIGNRGPGSWNDLNKNDSGKTTLVRDGEVFSTATGSLTTGTVTITVSNGQITAMVVA